MNKENDRRQKIGDEFKQLQVKLFIRTAIMAFAAVIGTFGLYIFVLAGHLANGIVGVFNFFTKDYDAARNIYQQVIRNYMDLYVILAIVVVFLVVLRIYLKGFTKYFNEIKQYLIYEERDVQEGIKGNGRLNNPPGKNIKARIFQFLYQIYSLLLL